MSEPMVSNADAARQYVTFVLGGEVYAFDVENAREILDFTPPARLPNAPPWLCGVINLRGAVVPVVDLKLKYGMAPTEKTRKTCIIIVELDLRGRAVTLGVLADAVQEVFEMDPSQIEPAPTLGAQVSTQFIRGMGKRNDKLFVILAAEKVFSEEEVAAFGGAAESVEPRSAEPSRDRAPALAAQPAPP